MELLLANNANVNLQNKVSKWKERGVVLVYFCVVCSVYCLCILSVSIVGVRCFIYIYIYIILFVCVSS